MANQEQLDILKQGVEAWNQWRKEHADVQPDLSFADLDRANLGGANLTRTNLSYSHLDGANLSKANLSKADLDHATLKEANLSKADLDHATLRGTILNDADLNGARFVEANLLKAHLSGADLSNSFLLRATLILADLSHANLSGANLSGADLDRAILSRADLSGADLGHATLSTASLHKTNLAGAKLSGANLAGAKLSFAYLDGADLSFASLTGADLNEADLSRAKVRGTFFGNVDLSEVKGLETVKHEGKSYIDIHTIYDSGGNIPEIFLRGIGAPETMIEYMHSFVGKPIDYYSCFISYSSKDQDFAERLYTDLQSKGVRCWFAPEHMKIGDEIRTRLDESIRTYDKLLLVLSEHSVQSSWVKKEVETAFEKEDQQRRLVLFPVRLDDTVMQTNQAWAADIRRMRHIGDFHSWKNHGDYQKAFDRLLRNLKAEAEKTEER